MDEHEDPDETERAPAPYDPNEYDERQERAEDLSRPEERRPLRW